MQQKKYVASNIESVTLDEANRAEVTLTTLQENGLLPNPLKDSRGNTFDSNKTIVIISGKDNKYSYQISVGSDLYDTDKKWANARTAEGSMWVWIPAYAYQIATNYHTSTADTINIKFLKGLTKTDSDGTTVGVVPTYSGSSQTNFIEHPGFRFGSNRVAGIWVAKFEASVANTSDPCYTTPNETNCDKSTLVPKIVSNATSWRCINIKNAFTVSRNMETNSVYGIYDMSGGAYERTMSNYNNKGASSGWTDAQVAAIDSKYIDRYYTDPTQMLGGTGFNYDISIYGDAIYETSANAARYNGTSWEGTTNASWNSDLSYTPYVNNPWFLRGGDFGYAMSAGAFAFYGAGGGALSHYGFRPVVVIGTGL